MSHNSLRGEAEISMGLETFKVAVTFGGLARLSQATKAQTMDEIYRRILGFEPVMVACAIRCLIVADDDDKASALSARVLDDANISVADQESWRQGMEAAFLAHIEHGKRRRDERTAYDIAETSTLGEQVSPS